jgi:uroporphyrinogen-III synthase
MNSHLKKSSLQNKTIVITRPLDSVKVLKARIESEGGSVILFPTISIDATENWDDCDQAIANLERFDWIVFSSQNSANFFLNRLSLHKKIIRKQKIGVIGAKTAEFVAAHHMTINLVPETYSASGFLEAVSRLNLKKRTFLLPVSNIAREELVTGLTAMGHDATAIVVYKTVTNHKLKKETLYAKLRSRAVDCIAFYSPSAFTSFLELMEEEMLALIKQAQVPLAAIGSTTAAAIKAGGFIPHIMAKKSSDDGMLEAIRAYYCKEKDVNHVTVS